VLHSPIKKGRELSAMGRYLIIVLLLLSACSNKNIDLSDPSRDKTFQELKGATKVIEVVMLRIYAFSPKGELTLHAQKGNGNIKWDEKGLSLFVSRDYVQPQRDLMNESWIDYLEKMRKALQGVYTKSSVGKMDFPGETYVQWDEKGATFFAPKL
jgi:hypothetical protein